MARGGMSEADRVKVLEAIAQDEDTKASTRLRAIEELGRIEARKQQQAAQDEPDEQAPDPMGDLEADGDELARRRRRRAG